MAREFVIFGLVSDIIFFLTTFNTISIANAVFTDPGIKDGLAEAITKKFSYKFQLDLYNEELKNTVQKNGELYAFDLQNLLNSKLWKGEEEIAIPMKLMEKLLSELNEQWLLVKNEQIVQKIKRGQIYQRKEENNRKMMKGKGGHEEIRKKTEEENEESGINGSTLFNVMFGDGKLTALGQPQKALKLGEIDIILYMRPGRFVKKCEWTKWQKKEEGNEKNEAENIDNKFVVDWQQCTNSLGKKKFKLADKLADYSVAIQFKFDFGEVTSLTGYSRLLLSPLEYPEALLRAVFEGGRKVEIDVRHDPPRLHIAHEQEMRMAGATPQKGITNFDVVLDSKYCPTSQIVHQFVQKVEIYEWSSTNGRGETPVCETEIQKELPRKIYAFTVDWHKCNSKLVANAQASFAIKLLYYDIEEENPTSKKATIYLTDKYYSPSTLLESIFAGANRIQIDVAKDPPHLKILAQNGVDVEAQNLELTPKFNIYQLRAEKLARSRITKFHVGDYLPREVREVKITHWKNGDEGDDKKIGECKVKINYTDFTVDWQKCTGPQLLPWVARRSVLKIWLKFYKKPSVYEGQIVLVENKAAAVDQKNLHKYPHEFFEKLFSGKNEAKIDVTNYDNPTVMLKN